MFSNSSCRGGVDGFWQLFKLDQTADAHFWSQYCHVLAYCCICYVLEGLRFYLLSLLGSCLLLVYLQMYLHRSPSSSSCFDVSAHMWRDSSLLNYIVYHSFSVGEFQVFVQTSFDNNADNDIYWQVLQSGIGVCVSFVLTLQCWRHS